MKNYVSICLLVVLMLSGMLLRSQTIISKALDSSLSALSKPNEPGFALAIIQNNKIRYSGSFGMADLSSGRKNKLNTAFDIASMSKQFTAACIYLLEQMGKLNTSDKLSKYFPNLPSYADSITIAHLIHHQSGLRDYKTLFWLRNMEENTAYGNTEVLYLLAKQHALNFTPGTQYSYSNTGYYFLSEIIRKVSGKDLSDFSREQIFKPLHMGHTAFSRTHEVRGKANGYIIDGESFKIDNPRDSTIGQGNAYSIAGDWRKWFTEMKNHKLLGDSVWNKMLSPAQTSDGSPTNYAGGLSIRTYQGKPSIIHGGDISGYHSKMAYFPKEDLGVVILSNNDKLVGDDILEIVYSELFIPKKSVNPILPGTIPVETDPVKLPPLRLDSSRYIGNYSLDENKKLIFEIKIANGELIVTQLWDDATYPIEAVSDSLFYIKGNKTISFMFHHAPDGKTKKIGITQDKQLMLASRDEDISSRIAAQNMDEYTGRFYNQEIDAEYTISLDHKNLMLKIGEMEFKIFPKGIKDSYDIIGNGMSMTFKRNKGQIYGFDLDHVRVKDLHFIKK